MKKIITFRLLRKCLILAVMIVGLVFVASSDRYVQPVAALPCCEGCTGGGDPDQIYIECSGMCGADSACFNLCVSDANACYFRCTYCGGGGPPGGNCNSNSDCNFNEYCGADNECHSF